MSALKIAEVTGQSYSDVKESEYQPGQWTHRVYVVGGDYYTVTRGTRAPVITDPRTGAEWGAPWERVECPWAAHRPGTVWRSLCQSE